MILNPGHSSVHIDQHLSIKSLELFDKLLLVIDDHQFSALRIVVGELSQKAQAAVAAHRRELSGMRKDVSETLNAEGVSAPEMDFLPQDEVFDGLDGPFAGLEGTLGEWDAVGFEGLEYEQVPNDVNFMDGGMLDLEFIR
jgi:hypothetical protein